MTNRATNRARAVSFAASVLVQGALVLALLEGLAGTTSDAPRSASVFAYDVPLHPPPPPPTPSPPPPDPPAPKPKSRPSPKPAPPAKPKPLAPAPPAKPAPVTVPEPRIVLREPVVAAPVSGSGLDARGGEGQSGQGSGGGGGGNGGGGGAGSGGRGSGSAAVVRRAEKIAGEIRARDFPRAGAAERNGRSTIVRYEVGADGRVRNCRVTQSSGSAEADAITCRVIEQRFRYRPARDASGRPVPDVTGWRQWWWQ